MHILSMKINLRLSENLPPVDTGQLVWRSSPKTKFYLNSTGLSPEEIFINVLKS